MDSILITIKGMLGISSDDTTFDIDILVLINSALMVLRQLGIGSNDFSVSDSTQTWSQLITSGTNLEGVKTYLYLKVRVVFDPPSSSAVLEAFNRVISELESRLMIQADFNTNPIVVEEETEDV